MKFKKIALLNAFLFAFTATPLMARDFAGVIYRVKGKVQFQSGSRKNARWVRARRGMGLMAKDRIRTSTRSVAKILLDDGSFHTIKQRCDIEIMELVYNRKTKVQRSAFMIRRGTMLSRIQKLRGKSRATFRSPTALVAVRGTELGMEVEEDETTHVALFEGRIIVRDFVEESILPSDQEGLLLEFLHEVSLKAGRGATITKEGIRRKRLTKKMKTWKEEFTEIREENEKAIEEQAKLSYEEAQAARLKAREEALESEKE